MTGDPYKETYIEPLSQRPPNNSTFLRTLTVPRKLYFSHGTSSCSTHFKLREHQIPIKQCSKNIFGMCDLDDPETAATPFPPDRKTSKSTTFTLTETISLCKKKNAYKVWIQQYYVASLVLLVLF